MRLAALLLLFICPVLADSQLPFLTFSDATLLVSKQVVIGTDDRGQRVSFPVLSYGQPRQLRRQHARFHLDRGLTLDGDLLLIVDDDVNFVAHYFHFMEHLLGIWNFCISQESDQVKMILFAFETPSIEDDHAWEGGYHQTTKLLLTSLFPNASIGLLRDLSPSLSVTPRKIYVSSRLRSHGIPEANYTNMNGSARFNYCPERLRQMRDRLFNRLGVIVEPPGDHLRVTYCKRTKGRILDIGLEEKLLEAVARETAWPVKVVDFAEISFYDQLQTIANTDLLIGVHGNGLTHLLFLPDHATVLEYYQGGESAFFRLFASLRGLRYYGNSGMRWETEKNQSIENRTPYQDTVTHFDLQGSLDRIKSL